MKFFAGYIKRYSLKIAIIFLLLAAEAVLCLVTPAIFGNIVDTGIMCKGFGEDYPKVISRSAFALFSEVLPENEAEILKEAYVQHYDTPEEFAGKYSTTRVCYYVDENADDKKLTELYQNAVMSAIFSVREISGYEEYDYDDFVNRVSLDSLNMLVGSVSLSEENKVSNYNEAKNTDASVKIQVGSILLPYVYEDANIDCDIVQQEYIINQTVIMIVCVVLQCVCATGSLYLLARLSATAEKDLRLDLMKKAFSLRKSDMFELTPDMFSWLFRSGVNEIGFAINSGFRMLFYSFFVSLIGCVITFLHNAVFGCIILGSSVLIVFVIFVIFLVASPVYYRMQAVYSRFSYSVRNNLEQLFAIRTLNAQKYEQEKAREKTKIIRKGESFVINSVLIALSLIGLVMNLLIAGAVVFSGDALLSSGMKMGHIVTDIQYCIIVVSSFLLFGAALIFAPKAFTAMKDIEKILTYHTKSETNQQKCPENFERIRFESLRLFEKSEPIDFVAEKGQLIVITGATGTGKTVLADAIMGDFVPFEGSVKIDDMNVLSFDNGYPGKHIAFMPSTPVLFSDTIRKNMILYGAEENEEQMLDALKKAQCDFLPSHKGALEIVLQNKGEKYSGGQRSRLALACVFAKKSPVYIFDDCLNSVNKSVRNDIVRNIMELKKEATVFVVSQDYGDFDADGVIELK